MQPKMIVDKSESKNDHDAINIAPFILLIRDIYVCLIKIMRNFVPIMKKYMRYIFLMLEIYLMIFDVLMVKLWLILNFVCTLLNVYMALEENNCDDKKMINIFHIYVLAFTCIIMGGFLLLFSTSYISFLSLIMVIYLMIRLIINMSGFQNFDKHNN